MANKIASKQENQTLRRQAVKKALLPILFLMLSLLFTACGGAEASETQTVNTRGTEYKTGTEIVTTIFPEYDWTREILGENPGDIRLTLLLDNGVDLHSYQPTAEDILRISRCDIFIYVGGESDKWVADALKEATNKDMTVINLLDVLGEQAKEEELVEGMQGEDEHEHEHEEDHEHEEGEEHEHEEEKEYDEHVWLSLRNAKTFVKTIEEAIEAKDPANKAVYEENLKNYTEKLEALDGQYKDAVKAGTQKTLLFGDRFPFRYLVDDYGLSYFAAFVGCSAETEASFETVTFLAGKVDELGLKSIFVIEGSDKRIAETIRNSSKEKNAELLTLNSMQGTSKKDIEAGATYLSIMTENLEVLKQGMK